LISRIWHGWTTPANADVYDSLLREEIFQGIAARQLPGFVGIDRLRRELGDTVELVTRNLLLRFDDRSAHYEVRERRP
jgi:hypothetical protein